MKILNLVYLFIFILFLVACKDDSEDITGTLIEEIQTDDRQRVATNFQVITPCEAFEITFYIDQSCVGTDYENGVLEAINEYNDLDLTLRYIPAASATGADLIFNCVDGDWCAFGIGSTPSPLDGGVTTTFSSGGQMGGEVTFSTNWEYCPCTDWSNCEFAEIPACAFKRAAMRAIGQTLGMLDNDANNGVHVPYTPNGNQSSNVHGTSSIFNDLLYSMLSENCEYCQECEFNWADVLALAYLYGCPATNNVNVSATGVLNPGSTIDVTSTPSGETAYTVWAIYEGIPTRFFVHEQCGDQPLTTQYTLENDPLMECQVEFFVERCNSYDKASEYSLGNVSLIFPSIDDAYPQLGETVPIKTYCNGQADYSVRLRYELYGQVQYQHVTYVNCDSSSDTPVELWSNPDLAYSTVTIEGIRNGVILGTKDFTIFP